MIALAGTDQRNCPRPAQLVPFVLNPCGKCRHRQLRLCFKSLILCDILLRRQDLVYAEPMGTLIHGRSSSASALVCKSRPSAHGRPPRKNWRAALQTRRSALQNCNLLAVVREAKRVAEFRLFRAEVSNVKRRATYDP